MGYCATGYGGAQINRRLTQAEIDSLQSLSGYGFDIDVSPIYNSADKDGVYLSAYDKYRDEDMWDFLRVLDKLPVTGGEFEFRGEDDELWRFIFRNGRWYEESGHVEYEPSRYPLNLNPQNQQE